MGRKKLTLEEVKERIHLANKNVEVTSTEYVNSFAKVSCKCKIESCKHEWSARPIDLFKGVGCPKCGRRTVSLKTGLGLEEVNKRLEKSPQIPTGSYFLLDQEYLGKSKPHKYHCSKCCEPDEFVFMRPANLMSGQRSGCCANKTVTSKNNISKLRPDLVKYFKNEYHAKAVTPFSRAKIELKCPECGAEKTLKSLNLCETGFVCNVCSDTIPKTEKFMVAVLNQLNVEFKKEKVFEWNKNSRYDFYVPSKNLIIETHGEQHYEVGNHFFNRCDSQKETDAFKRETAIENGFNYVEVDFRKSNIEWLKQNSIKSLFDIFDLSLIDWQTVCDYANNSLLTKLKNDCGSEYTKESVKRFSDEVKVNIKTVKSWVRFLNEIDKEVLDGKH